MGWLGVLMLAVSVSSAGESLEVGDVAPRVLIRQPSGEWLDSHALAGVPYVIDFWSPLCAPCRGTVPSLNAAHQRLSAVGGAVIGRASHGPQPAELEQVTRQWEIGFPVGTPVMPGHGDQGDAFFVTRLPATFVVGADGRVAAAFYRLPSAPQLLEAVAKAIAEAPPRAP